MAKQVQPRASKLRGEGISAGCLWGLFDSFDVHQRFRLRKMLGERRGTAHRRHATGTKEPKMTMDVPPASDERGLAEADAKISVEDRVEPTDKPSSKSRRRKSIAQEISKQQDAPKQKGHRRNVTPFATRLLRTISIHHMESDDYEHPNEMPEDRQIPDPSLLLSQTRDPSAGDAHMPTSLVEPAADEVDKGKRCEPCGTTSTDPAGHVCHKKLDVLGYQLLEQQALVREKLMEAKRSLLEPHKGGEELQGSVAHRHSSDILEALELFNANNELFLKLLQEPGAAMANDLEGQEDSSCGRALTKCSSFPGAGLSARGGTSFELQNEATPSEKQEEKSKPENLQSLENADSTKDDKAQFFTESTPPRPAPPFAHGILEAASTCELSSSFTHAVKRQRDKGSASNRFKVIKQRIKDIIKDNKKEKQRIAMDSVLHKVPYGCKASQGLPWEGPDSDRCDGDGARFSFGSDAGGSSTCRISFSSVPRSQSLSESVERYAHLLESTSRREPKPQVSERLKLAHEDGGSQVTKPLATFGRIFSLPAFEAYFSKDEQTEVSHDLSQLMPTPLDPAEGNEESMDVSGDGEQSLSRSLDDGGPDAGVLDREPCAASSVFTTGNVVPAPSDEQVAASCMEAGDTPEEPSPVAVIDSYLAQDPVIPSVSSLIQAGSELETDPTQFEKQDLSDSQENQSDVNDSNTMETDEGSNANDAQLPGMQLHFDALHVPVDKKHEMEFNYVRGMLKTYLFDGSELSEGRLSPGKQLDPSLSEDAEVSAQESESDNGYVYPDDINLDRELLYDLTNQILIDICESSYGHTPWLPCMGSHVRPVPVGYHLLEEVWVNISWHLKSESHAPPTLDYIIERDFKKNDGWMNLTRDVEHVGLDLETLLLDDLLEEAVVEVLE